MRLNRLFPMTFFFMIAFAACKKDVIDIPENQDGEPIFQIDFAVNNQTYQLEAGRAGYFMHTRYAIDADEVLTYIGNFAPEDCSDSTCPERIQFEIRSDQFAPETNPETDLSVRGYQAKDDTETVTDVYQIRLSGTYEEADLSQFYWTGFGSSLRIFNQADIIYNKKDDGEIFSPVFKVESTHGHFASISRKIPLVGSEYCDADFNVNIQQDDSLVFEAVYDASTTLTEFDFFWLEGEEAMPGFGFEYSPNLDSLINVEYSLTLTTADNCFADVTKTFSMDNDGNLRYSKAGYDYDILQRLDGGSQLGLSSFAVEYTDADGKLYRSDWDKQPETSFFNVLNTKNYINNAEGQPTKQLEIEFQCRVFAADNSFLDLANGNGNIGVAYPN